MRELYTLEILRLVRELKALEGFYVEQFYEVERNKFRIKLSMGGEKINLQCMLPYAINRTEFIELREEATNFSIAVRKRIANSKIKQVSQLNNDRIMAIALERAGSETNMIFEMFGKGNMIVADSKMMITLAYSIHDYKDRSVRPNRKYEPPRNSSVNIMDPREIKAVCGAMGSSGPDSTVANYLNKRIGIGSMYLMEAITRSGIAPESRVRDVDRKLYGKISDSINGIVRECTENPKFLVYNGNGVASNFALCEMSRYSLLKADECASLEACLDIFYRNSPTAVTERSGDEKKISASMEKQKGILQGIDKEIRESKAMGDYIMNHMHELNSMIDSIRSNKNITEDEIKEIPSGARILSLNKKNKSVRIEVDGGE